MNGDGKKDFIISSENHISSYDNSGEKVWSIQVDIHLTAKAERQGLPGLHAPGVQAADINGDTKTEVLFLGKDNNLQIINGENGKSLKTIPLVSPVGTERWEHLVVGNFRGLGDRDLLLQTTNSSGHRFGRYIAAYAIEDLISEGRDAVPLWSRNDFFACMHNGAKLADLDGDGKDEVIGGSIVGSEGEILSRIPLTGHIDSIFVSDVRPDIPGLEVVALEEWNGFWPFKGRSSVVRFANKVLNSLMIRLAPRENRIFLFNHEGLIWVNHYKHREPQNAAVGEFDLNRPGQEIWCRSRNNTHQKPFLFDAQGTFMGSYAMDDHVPSDWTIEGVEEIFSIDWSGKAKQLIAAKERHTSGDVAIIDPSNGNFLHRFKEKADRLYVVDVSGDWREEIVVLNRNELRIYENTDPNPYPNRPRLWRQKHYKRNKMTWNYYSP